MRGEHFTLIEIKNLETGSPPHARGTQIDSRDHSDEERITPACAGNTVMGALTREDQQDHPRMRGEHVNTFFKSFLRKGSPPHARGTRGVLLYRF